MIIAIFTGVNRSLKNAVALKEGHEVKEPISFWEAIAAFAVKEKIKFGLIVLFVLGGFSTLGWDALMTVGVFGGNGFEKQKTLKITILTNLFTFATISMWLKMGLIVNIVIRAF
jgi:hypothetical protein